jgi:hypothetical protein
MRRKLLQLFSLCVLAALTQPAAWAQPSPAVSGAAVTAVARVAVTVGETLRVAPGGQTQTLQVGSSLMPGDRVRTGPDAVAILVFADEGRISLRADSELLIRHYEIDPAGVKTRIELELIKGTVRQISGNASRSQPDRYRLNTPIAVIGVRGTDFIAKTASDAVEAFVHEGRIVLLARTDGCAEGSTAGCDPLVMASSASNLRYVRLSAAGQVEQREFRPGELEKVFGIETASARGASPALARAQGGTEFQLPLGTQFITDTIFVAGLGQPARSGESTPVSAPVVPAAAAPENPVVAVAPLPKDLVWGRFGNGQLVNTQLAMLTYEAASSGRHVTVGELGEYALWRTNPSGRLDTSLKGSAQFALAASEAWLTQPSGTTSAQVKGATLSVDFDLSTFAATVALNHVATGDANVAVKGRVNDEGLFVGTTATDRVAGSLTRDGKEAGYLFSKDVSAGTFRGVTLWGRK